MATSRDSDSLMVDGKSLKRPQCPDSLLDFEKKRSLMEVDSDKEDKSCLFSSVLTIGGCARVMWELHDLAARAEKSKASTSIHSPSFATGNGQTWRLIVYPNYNNEGTVGVFLEVPTISGEVKVYFSLDFYLQTHTDRFCKERTCSSTNTFSYYNQNYGWKKALVIDTCRQPLSKSLIIECFVKPENEQSDTKPLGYVGIVNEGTTCYLNSLLQTLYHISAFRKAVYLLPTNEDTNTIPLSLQRVFYSLQVKKEAVSTRELLLSFGWGFEELNTQHDVQEFNCVLSDTLDRKMKGTEAEGTFAKLFEGQMNNFIKCINVNYESKREEKFIDLQLNVKGCASLQESFKKYLEVEHLRGDDLYDAEHFGKQEAEKGINFLRLPPVLQLQLKRFEYDPVTEAMGKVHDRFEFPVTLDLSEFLPEAPDSVYELFSVLIHSGTTAAGHYFAFIRPTLRDWLKFNDELVEKVSQDFVNQCSYGGELKALQVDDMIGIQEKPTRNEMSAYMLVYIQKSFAKDIIFPIKNEEIPQHLHERFSLEERQREERRTLDIQRKQRCDVLTVTNEIVKDWDKAGLTPSLLPIYSRKPFAENLQCHVRWNLKKSMSVSALRRHISKRIGDRKCRLWIFSPGYKNWRFEPLSYDSSGKVGTLFEDFKRALYVEVEDNYPLFRKKETSDTISPVVWDFSTIRPSDEESVSSDSTAPVEEEEEGDALSAPLKVAKSIPIFYKWYQYTENRGLLSLLASVNISGDIKADKVRDDIYIHYLEEERSPHMMINLYIEKAFSDNAVKAYVKFIPSSDNPLLTTTRNYSEFYLEPGDVIIGEIVPESTSQGYITASEYLNNIINCVSVRFCYKDKFEFYPFRSFSRELFESQGIVKEVERDMKLGCSQRDLMEALAKYFQSFSPSIQWEQILLYKHDAKTRRIEDLPFPDTRGVAQENLMGIVDTNGCVYFDIMKYSIAAIKNGCLVHCVYIGEDFTWMRFYCELLRRGACMTDLKAHVNNKLRELENGKSSRANSTMLALNVNFRQKTFTEELKDNSSLYDYSISTQNLIALVVIPDMPPESKQKVYCSVWFPDNEPASDPFLLIVVRRETIHEVLARVIERVKFPKPKLYLGRTSRNYAKELDVTRGDLLEDSQDGWIPRYVDGAHVIAEVQRPRTIKQALVLRESE